MFRFCDVDLNKLLSRIDFRQAVVREDSWDCGAAGNTLIKLDDVADAGLDVGEVESTFLSLNFRH